MTFPFPFPQILEAVAAGIPGSGNDAFTKLLLHFDEQSGVTTHIDSSASQKQITPSGTVDNTDVAWKLGGTAGHFSSSRLTIPDDADFTLGSGDWTFDCWVYNSDTASNRQIFCQNTNSNLQATGPVQLERNAGSNFRAFVGNGTTFVTVTGTTAPVTGQWYHLAVVRTGNIIKLFVDGVQEGGDVAFTGAVYDSANLFQIGGGGSAAQWNGYIDEFRFSKGIARWTANFTPPTSVYRTADDTVPTATLAFVTSAENLDGDTITLPTVSEGDVLVLLSIAKGSAADPADASISGWIKLGTVAGIGTFSRWGLFCRLAASGDSGSIVTCVPGSGTQVGHGEQKLLVFRTTPAAKYVKSSSVAITSIASNPAAQTVWPIAEVPNIILGGYGSPTAFVNPRTFSPAEDATIAWGVGREIKYKLYNGQAARALTHSIDMADEGAENNLISLSLDLAAAGWRTAWLNPLTAQTTGYGGWTVIQEFTTLGGVGIRGASKLRFRFNASLAAATSIVNCYIGHAAAAGDAYDFDAATITQVTFGGAAGFTLAAAGIIVSDAITFALDNTRPLLCAFLFSPTSSVRRNIAGPERYWQKNTAGVSETATADKTGYGSPIASIQLIDRVEVLV
jgi:Concanavalin A-like lectin/glucanases superfamily